MKMIKKFESKKPLSDSVNKWSKIVQKRNKN